MVMSYWALLLETKNGCEVSVKLVSQIEIYYNLINFRSIFHTFFEVLMIWSPAVSEIKKTVLI